MALLWRRLVLPSALLGLSLAGVLLVNAVFFQPSTRASHGILDLQKWDFSQDAALLAGEWAFFWNQYLPADSVDSRTIASAPAYLVLPGVWNNLNYPDAQITMLGQATLALELHLAAGAHYVLKIPTLTNRYRLWIDGKLVVNDNLEEPRTHFQETNQFRLIHFDVPSGKTILVFHLLNDRHRTGGIWEELKLTRSEYVSHLDEGPWLWDTLNAFGLSLAAVALVVLALRRQQWAYFYLAIFAALMSVRAGTVNERVLFELLGIRDWNIQQALEHGTLYASFPFYALFLGFRYPSYFPPLLHWVCISAMSVLLVLVLITPPSVYSHTIIIVKSVAVLYCFLWLSALVEHLESRNWKAYLLFGGSLLLVLGVVNDVLYTSNYINSMHLSHTGALAFFVATCIYPVDMVKTRVLLEKEAQPLPASDAEPSDDAAPDEEPHPLKALCQHYESNPESELLRSLLAASMSHALQIWQDELLLSKVELAEQSGLWRVTNDAGTLKTRTLDKYLKAEALPKNPRIKTVSKTLRFVAGQPGVRSEDAQWLAKAASLIDAR